MPADLLVRVGAEISQFKDAMREVSQSLNKVERETGRIVGGLERFGGSLRSIGTTLSTSLTLPLVAFGGAATKAYADIDALRRGLIGVTGSAAEAERQLARLAETAKLPGLGFREAVQAAIMLQTVGFKFEQAVRIIEAFGNALAAVGRGREDLNEVLRQLTQLEARGKVTADNLRPIIERVPQVARIIKDAFGTLDTEVLQRMGVRSREFIEIIVSELERLPRVTGGVKNEMENLRDAMERALAKAGEALMPVIARLLESGARAAETIASLAKVFLSLPPAVQQAVLVLGTVTVVLGPVAFGMGQLITTITSLSRLFLALPAQIGAIVPALSTIGQAALVAAAAFAGWQVGRWLDENVVSRIPILNKFLDLVAAFPAAIYDKLTGASEKAASANRDLAHAVAMLEERLRAKGIRVERGNLTLEQYATKLREAAGQAGLLAGGQQKVAGTAESAAAAKYRAAAAAEELKRKQEEADKQARELADALETLGVRTRQQAETERLVAAWNTVAAAYERGKVSAEVLAAAHAALQERLTTLRLDQVAAAFDGLTIRINANWQATESLANAASRYVQAMNAEALASLPSWWDQLNAVQNESGRTMQMLSEISSIYVQGLPDVFYKTVDTTDKTSKEWQRLGAQISTIVTDMSRGIADAILKAKGFGDVFKRVLEEVAQAVVRFVVEVLVNKLIATLKQIAEGDVPAVGQAFRALGGIVEDVGKAIARVFGARSGATAAGSAGPSAAPAAGAPAATGGGLAGVLDVVSSVTTAITGVLSYFQGRRMEQDIGRIEVTTREIRSLAESLVHKADEWWPWLKNLADPAWQAVGLLAGIYDAVTRMAGGRSSAAVNLTVNVSGSQPAAADTTVLARRVTESLVRELKYAGYTVI